MTCREKLMMEHPNMVDHRYFGGCVGCPSRYSYLDRPTYCKGVGIRELNCEKCWDREIPENQNSTVSAICLEMELAKNTRDLYTAYIEVGFTENQAFSLVIEYIKAGGWMREAK